MVSPGGGPPPEKGFKAFQRSLLERIGRAGGKSSAEIEKMFAEIEKKFTDNSGFGLEGFDSKRRPSATEATEAARDLTVKRQSRDLATYATYITATTGETSRWDRRSVNRPVEVPPLELSRAELERLAKKMGLQVVSQDPSLTEEINFEITEQVEDTTKPVSVRPLKTKRQFFGEESK